MTPSAPLINDVFNKGLDKQISGFSLPQMLVIAFSYTTPTLSASTSGFKLLSVLARDWTYSGVLRYQSGQILQSPFSSNNLLFNMGRGNANNNPAVWGGGNTFLDRVPGQPLFTVDPNSKFDPTKALVLNPNAWVEPPFGTFGASAPYFNDFRWQRQPAESMSFGRNFRFGRDGRYDFFIRAEFTNIFNRLMLSPPATGNQGAGFGGPVTIATPASSTQGVLTGGLGYIPTYLGQTAVPPRAGQIVGRFVF